MSFEHNEKVEGGRDGLVIGSYRTGVFHDFKRINQTRVSGGARGPLSSSRISLTVRAVSFTELLAVSPIALQKVMSGTGKYRLHFFLFFYREKERDRGHNIEVDDCYRTLRAGCSLHDNGLSFLFFRLVGYIFPESHSHTHTLTAHNRTDASSGFPNAR